MPLSDEDVREILRIIDESELDELQIQTESFSLHVRKGGSGAGAPLPSPPAAAQPAREAAGAPEPPAQQQTDGLVTIESPMLGTFYRADSPGAKPFVQPGDRVEADTIVCIIEVMKMMNSVPAGVSGEIVEICSENAELVEYGQPLFRVHPA
jgi:acetyl-CoA carboxylase biotin carboxyl carrier protein